MSINCPHCKGEIHFNATVKQAIGARTGMKLTPKKGAMLTAISVGESVAAFARLLDAAADDIGPHKTMQMLEKITTDKDGAITATFITAIIPPKTTETPHE